MNFNYKKVEFSCDCCESCKETNVFLLQNNPETSVTVIYYKRHISEEDSIYQKVMTLSDNADAALTVALQSGEWNEFLTEEDYNEFLNLK